MEVIEFLIALFILFTLPSSKRSSELVFGDQNQQDFKDDWSVANRDDRVPLHIAGMWIDSNKWFK
tara:strand:- start:694 stop:888 length:195 start_codon:yes stop_codon:yes gene_type:complete